MRRIPTSTWLILMSLAIPFAQSIPSARAQQLTELRGTVYDAATNAGVPDVTLTLAPISTVRENPTAQITGSGVGVQRTTTGPQGGFRFAYEAVPGETYTLSIRKPGYQPPYVPPAEIRDGIRIPINRLAGISGRVEDADSGEPVAGLSVVVAPLRNLRVTEGPAYASSNVASGDMVRTGPDGGFSVSGQQPGDYVVVVRPAAWGQSQGLELSPEATPDPPAADNNAQDNSQNNAQNNEERPGELDYAVTFWPGGENVSVAQPFPVAFGANADTGVIRVRKTLYYRARVRFPESSCEAGAPYQAVLHQHAGLKLPAMRQLGDVPCATGFLVRGLLPGDYRLEVFPRTSPGGPPPAVRSVSDFTVTSEDVELDLTFQPGVELTGRAVMIDGKPLESSGLQLALRAVDSFDPGNGAMETRIDADGLFHFLNLPLGLKQPRIGLRRGPQDVYLVGIRYKGLMLTEPVFRWDGTGQLELVFDDQPGGIRGTVTDGRSPSPNAITMAVRWPLPESDWDLIATGGLFAKLGRASTTGEFDYAGMPDGEYRILAFPLGEGEQLARDGRRLRQLAPRGTRAIVRRGQITSVTVETIDPNR